MVISYYINFFARGSTDTTVFVTRKRNLKFHKSNYRVTLRNSDDYKLPYVRDKNTFKSDVYRCFNDLPLDLRKEINNSKFISGAKSFFINKALARLS